MQPMKDYSPCRNNFIKIRGYKMAIKVTPVAHSIYMPINDIKLRGLHILGCLKNEEVYQPLLVNFVNVLLHVTDDTITVNNYKIKKLLIAAVSFVKRH